MPFGFSIVISGTFFTEKMTSSSLFGGKFVTLQVQSERLIQTGKSVDSPDISFFMKMEYTAKQLAKILKGTVEGDPDVKVTDFAKIEHGQPGNLCFYANPKYEHYVYTCKASVLLVNKDFELKQPVTPTLIRVENAYSSLADLLKYVSTQNRTDRRDRKSVV